LALLPILIFGEGEKPAWMSILAVIAIILFILGLLLLAIGTSGIQKKSMTELTPLTA
jgi:hypothetical protein